MRIVVGTSDFEFIIHHVGLGTG